MVLKLLGSLIEPTDVYSSSTHRTFAKILTTFIKLIVGAVTPASFIIFVYLCWNIQNYKLLNSPSWSSAQWGLVALTIWCLSEIGFYLHCLNLKNHFAKNSSSYTKLAWSERQFYLQRILDHNPTPFKSLSKWFHTSQPHQVTVEDVEDWLAWAFFSKLKKDLNGDELMELSWIVEKCVEKDGSLPRTGNYANPLPFMKLFMDPIKFQHKPIIAYWVISAMQLYGTIFLAATGFKKYNCGSNSCLSYWIYNPNPNSNKGRNGNNNNNYNGYNSNSNGFSTTTGSSKPPVFLVYGIGIGVTMYLKVINAIRNKDPDRTIIVLDLPHISLKVVTQIPSMDQTLTAIDHIFKKHELSSCNWFGHSYGSIVTSWVIKERSKYVHKVSLVDPVCFALWEPDLIRNFLYNKYTPYPRGPIHHLAQFFVAKDLLVASTLFRNFWWLENILFPEDLPCTTHVYFSKYDWIIDAQGLHDYLVRRCVAQPELQLSVAMMDNVAHGGFISNDEKIAVVLKHV